jgi:hypothetical protein
MDLAEFLRDMDSNSAVAPKPRILPEAEIERLRDLAARYAAPNPFKVGDLVTPRRGGVIKDRSCGHPCVVVETFDPIFSDHAEVGSAEYLMRHTMRIAQYFAHEDSCVTMVADHSSFEFYTGTGA